MTAWPEAETTPALAPNLIVRSADGGRLAENIMHFGRVLRDAGLPVGPGKILDAVEAVCAAGIGNRADFYWTLHAVFVNRRDQREVFDQAFHVFWRNPDLLQRMLGMLLPTFRVEDAVPPKRDLSARVAEAMAGNRAEEDDSSPEGEEDDEAVDLDAALTFSNQEVLSEKDFESMTATELAAARKAIAGLRLSFRPVPSRRFRPKPTGRRIDLRATLRATARRGGEMTELRRRSRLRRPPPLVVLCDISGSMDRYARMMLHFLHALMTDRDRVHCFLFGTRLTNVTRLLRNKDPDLAISNTAEAIQDWAGGTRIGTCLHHFNRDWSRRVMSGSPVVLLITDGLDREGGAGLGEEMERLQKSCRRLIWLNPLLRFDGYEPRAMGAKAMMRHVDAFRPVHNLDSLGKLADALGDLLEQRGNKDPEMMKWRKLAV